ncbi:unnamed protein product [Cercopithifilaria johnstoni]|uniref:Uncharacterized protein n=1 Tax=Cercopithifilaria johnstoni TaxID=2874296 RepID=A0A8J2Q540_9BILA|nr:unnamed protein product [Cercopithifilaria johnstoni]
MIIDIPVCRLECAERNEFVAVRAYLKHNVASIGFCRNKTSSGARSFIVPFTCHRNIGIWEPDNADSEGVTEFRVPCPEIVHYPLEKLKTCPESM